jgi:hypothetical protein
MTRLCFDWQELEGERDEGKANATPNELTIGVWQGVAMDSLMFHPSPPCPTLVCLLDEPPLIQHYGRFRGGACAGRVTCGCLLLLWTPHVVRLC